MRIVFVLMPHCSHLLQPLDGSCKVYASTITAATNIQPAFEKSRIFPFSPNVIAYPQVAPSSFSRSVGQDKSNVEQTKSNTKNPLSAMAAEDFVKRRGAEILKSVETAKIKKHS